MSINIHVPPKLYAKTAFALSESNPSSFAVAALCRPLISFFRAFEQLFSKKPKLTLL